MQNHKMGQAWPMHNIDYRRLPNSLPVMGFPYKKSNCCQSKVYHLPTSLLHMNFLSLYRKFGLTIYRVFRLVVNPFLPPEMHDLCNINSNRKLEDFSQNRQRMDFKSLWGQIGPRRQLQHIISISRRCTRCEICTSGKNARLGETHYTSN